MAPFACNKAIRGLKQALDLEPEVDADISHSSVKRHKITTNSYKTNSKRQKITKK